MSLQKEQKKICKYNYFLSLAICFISKKFLHREEI